MALKLLAYKSPEFGITVPNAYCKIINATVTNMGAKDVVVDYAIFFDSVSAAEDKQPVGFGQLKLPFDTSATTDVVAQGYAKLKLMPEFTSSTNV